MRQRGFTLTEMLVASMVFLVGFTAVYSLFLAGAKFRGESDQMLRLTMASNNLVARLRMGLRGDQSPQAFLGDGRPGGSTLSLDDLSSVSLYTLPENPAILYSVYKASDARGFEDEINSSVRLHYAVINADTPFPNGTTLDELARVVRCFPSSGNDGADSDDESALKRVMTEEQFTRYENIPDTHTVVKAMHLLEQRGFALRSDAPIIRRP